MEAERRQIQETTTSELRRLGENLRAVATDELRTTESDTAAATARMRVVLLNAWLRPLVVGLIVFLGISGGSWALMHWLSASIQSRIETLATLEVQIEHARRDPGRDRGDNLGGDPVGDRRGALRGVAGRDTGPSALDRGRAACLEAVERGRELYERARGAFDGRLREAVRALRAGAAAARRADRSLACSGERSGAAERGERNLAAAVRAARRASETLGPGLQDARRDVARALDVMRRRSPARDRDQGPSR